jgi:predicted GNAT family acetyltransferase
VVNGSLLTLGAVGALALLGASRRGSADKAPLGPSKPLIAGFRYRAKQSRDGLAVFLYQGSKRVGFLDAYWRYSISSIEDESRRAATDPRRHLACYDDLRALGAEGRYPKILEVYGTELDESVRGKGAGKALYEALMAEAFDENGPFFFVPSACGSSRSSTSASAMRVWASLARAYPSSGVVVRVDSRPAVGSANRASGTNHASGAYTVEDVKALGYSDNEIKTALAKMQFSPDGNPAGPTESGRMDSDYRGIDFAPTQAMRDAAMKGLRLRKLNEARGKRADAKTGLGPGGMWIGVGRAIQIATEPRIPPRDVRRMVNYHSRHKVDKKAPGFGKQDKPTNGYVAWLLWGSDKGDEGKVWSERIERQMAARD